MFFLHFSIYSLVQCCTEKVILMQKFWSWYLRDIFLRGALLCSPLLFYKVLKLQYYRVKYHVRVYPWKQGQGWLSKISCSKVLKNNIFWKSNPCKKVKLCSFKQLSLKRKGSEKVAKSEMSCSTVPWITSLIK